MNSTWHWLPAALTNRLACGADTADGRDVEVQHHCFLIKQNSAVYNFRSDPGQDPLILKQRRYTPILYHISPSIDNSRIHSFLLLLPSLSHPFIRYILPLSPHQNAFHHPSLRKSSQPRGRPFSSLYPSRRLPLQWPLQLQGHCENQSQVHCTSHGRMRRRGLVLQHSYNALRRGQLILLALPKTSMPD
jgi:hypothetical protein